MEILAVIVVVLGVGLIAVSSILLAILEKENKKC